MILRNNWELILANILLPSMEADNAHTHIIFVHGLRGDATKTWLSCGTEADFWPRWLETDLSGVAVWSIGYAASATRWGGSAMYLPDAAENVLARLLSERVLANGTIIFVAHSLGGLIVKQLMRSADRDASTDDVRSSFLQRVRKVAFLATPHSGADLALIGNILRGIFRPSEASAGLVRNDPFLRDLNRWYRSYATEHNIQTLVLQEAHRTRFLGIIVKPDSSDPGIPGATLIPIEANHEAISKPADRSSEVYLHIRDFITQDNRKAHGHVQITSALSHLEETVAAGNARVLHEIKGALNQFGDPVRSVSESLADAEAVKRLSSLRRSRFFEGVDVVGQAHRLAHDLRVGDLASASTAVKVESLSWCARFLARSPGTEDAERILAGELLRIETVEVRVAQAFVSAARGHSTAALASLSGLTGGLVRTASLIIVTWESSAEDSIHWFRTAVGTSAELDGDGKFVLLQQYLKAGLWNEALSTANELTEDDFLQTPVLLFTAALAHLIRAVADDELKPLILRQTSPNLLTCPLAADEASLASRRQAQRLFAKAAEAAQALGCEVAASECFNRSLWLGLQDPANRQESWKLLQRSMSDPANALKRMPLALQFGLKLDLNAAENEVDRVTALSGGKSMDAAAARFALALTRNSPRDIADYIAKHRAQLHEYLGGATIMAIEVEMLARSGQSAEAETWLEQMLKQEGVDRDSAGKLRLLIAEAKSDDPIQDRIERYQESKQLSELLSLVHLLHEKQDWKRLKEFGGTLFERTHELSHGEMLAKALTIEDDDDSLLRLFEAYPEIAAQSDMLAGSFSWAFYRSGRLDEATKLLGPLRAKRDDSNDRALLVNIAIASGEWTSLLAFVEQEWASRGQRSAEETIGTAQLAVHVGSARSTDLIHEAVAKAPDDPRMLSACYALAVGAGMDDDPEVTLWMQRAAELSDADGPIKKVSLHELIAGQPDWHRRESETWDRLTDGQLPLFAAGHLLHRSLAEIYLRAALTNESQTDVRKRSVVLSYSGARAPANGDYGSVALDVTALLTLGLLGIVERVLHAFPRVYIPHATLGWLLEERQLSKFHQPSRVKDARELQVLLGARVLQPFEPSTQANGDLAFEIGDDLAAMIADAESGSDENKQRIVVRPSPVFRIGSLIEEPADLADHQKTLCSCFAVVEALKRLSQLTAAEEARARSYLKLHEQPWSDEAQLLPGAILYLDDLAVTYLHHLKLLPKLASQFTVFVSQSCIDEVQALLKYEALAARAADILEEIRRCLADGIKSSRVQLGHIFRQGHSEQPLGQHPSLGVYSLAKVAEALVIDDRAVNAHLNMNFGSGLCPILTTLDVLSILCNRGIFSPSEQAEFRATLRLAGLALIPVTSAELIALLSECPVHAGVLSETAELRSVRESVLRVQMTNVLQLPREHAWLDGLLRACIDALTAQWNDLADEQAATARSNWLLGLFDLRAWSHTSPLDASFDIWEQKCRIQWMLLLTIASSKPEPVQKAYWRWLEKAVLEELKYRDPDVYRWLISQTGTRIHDIVVEYVARESAGD